MKKITLWLFALFTCWQINAQVNLLQNFNGGTTLPTGWTETGGKTVSAAESCEGNSIRDNLYSSSATGTLVSPNQVGASNGTDLTFSFDYKIEDWNSTNATAAGWGNFTVDYSTDNGTTWTTFFTVNDANHVVSNTCANFSNVIPAANVPSGSDVRFRFNMTWTAGDYDIYFDNISATQVSSIAPECTTLISPADAAVNVTSSVISWSVPLGIPDGYYLTVGTTSGGNNILDNFDVGNVTSYNIGALTGSTTYYVTVVPYNSNGIATGCSETSFSSCNINAAPWTYDVEAAATTTNSSIADCWSSNPTGTTSAYRWDVDASGGTPSAFATGPSGANSGVKYFYTEASSGATAAVAELVSPLVDLTALADPSLQFFYHMWGVSMGELHVDINDGTGWTNDVFVLIGQQQTAQADPWREAIVSLSAYAGTTIQVRFRAIRGASYEGDIALDDITFDESPACFDPINLGAANITATTVDVLFTDGSGGNQFDFAYVVQPQGTGAPATYPAGTPEDGSNQINATDFSIPVTGLNSNTAYEIYVAADCNGDWIGPFNFTTLCDVFTVPSLEDFTTYVPACWEEADNGDLVAGPATFGSSAWVADGFGNVGTTGAMRINLDFTGDNDWILSPLYSIPATGYELKFDASANQWFSTNAPTVPWESDDFVEVLVSTGTTNWTVLFTYNDTNVPSNTGSTNIIDLDAYAGQNVRFAFRGVEGAVNGNADIEFIVDNFEIRETPTLPPSCATNVVGTPDVACGNFNNTITWDAVSGADGYNLTIGTTSGGNEILNNQDLGAVTSYVFAGTLNTTYYFTVVPYNANGLATGCGEFNFITNANGCYCVSAPTSVDGTGITNVQVVTTDFPNTVSSAPVYNDHTANVVDMFRGINNNIQITLDVTSFGSNSYDYNTVIWIDANDDYVLDASEIVFTGVSPTTAAPTLLDASFVMPASMALGQHRMRIVATDALQNPANPCYSGTYGETADFTINVVEPSCAPPVASTSVVYDCTNSQFSIDVNVTDLGNGSPVISDGTSTWPVSAIGTVNVGPFAFGTPVTLSILHGTDAACNLPLGTFNYAGCPPVNDDCENAIALTVNSDLACGVITSATNAYATASSQVDDVTGTPNNDVWFSFVATGTSHVVSLLNVVSASGTSTDMGMGVYDATGGCTSLTFVADSDPNTLNLNGLAIGNTYLVRVYNWGSNAANTNNFDICLGTPPAPPANDDCVNAEVLTPGGVFADNAIVGTNVSATSSTETAPGCANYLGGDVWYSAVVPASGSLTFEVNSNGGITDGAGAVYSGSCGALVLLDCDDSSSPTPNDQPLISVVGRTPGEVLYFRVWEYGNNAFGTFLVSAYDASLSSGSFDNNNFMAYPNPVKDVLNLSYTSEISTVSVMNMLGQEVISRNLNATTAQVDMSQLSAGTYIVNVTIGDTVKTIKVVKQ